MFMGPSLFWNSHSRFQVIPPLFPEVFRVSPPVSWCTQNRNRRPSLNMKIVLQCFSLLLVAVGAVPPQDVRAELVLGAECRTVPAVLIITNGPQSGCLFLAALGNLPVCSKLYTVAELIPSSIPSPTIKETSE